MALRELFELQGRTVLVTGGSRGLGLQLARALGEMGAKVAISARKADELNEAKAELAAAGINAFTVVNDLSETEQLRPLVDAVVERYGDIDILVNNAGASWGAPAAQHSTEAWDKVMNLNARSVFLLSQEVANRCFIPRQRGNIINVGSVSSLRVDMEMKAVAYYASKAAVVHLTRALACEWGPHGIRVNALCPGFFPSKLANGLLENIGTSIVARTPLGRLGGDDDLMGAVVFLASDASRHVTGQALAIDGGASIA
ncbi:SDR family oxidoreductase [Povalibacter sp.]|uniref:SDR family oxidoreductase n=1 Tax=Povalibacter sp. TaxID=1962978 RepID=UPI002F41A24C